MAAFNILLQALQILAVINFSYASSELTKRAYCGHDDTITFRNIGFIERGYNILRGYPLKENGDPGFGQQIFDTEYSGETTADCNYYVPDGWMIERVPSCSIKFEATTITGSSSLSKTLGVSVSASGGYAGLSFSASMEFQSQEDTMKTTSSKIIKSSATCQDFVISKKYKQYPSFSDTFRTMIRDVKSSVHNPDALRTQLFHMMDNFGTHYVTKLHFGAVYGLMYTLTSSEYEQLSSKSLSVKVQAEYSGIVDAGVSVGTDTSKTEASSEFREKASKKEFALGAKLPSDGDINTWANSALSNPYPIRYVLSSIDELFDHVKVPQIVGEGMLTVSEAQQIKQTLRDVILPGYCGWLQSDNVRVKCSSSSTFHEIPMLRFIDTYPFYFSGELKELVYPNFPLARYFWEQPAWKSSYITTLSSETGSNVRDHQSCIQRCMNAAHCTMSWFRHINHAEFPQIYVCQLMVREYDRGTPETQQMELTYQYSHMPAIEEFVGITDIIVSKLERPAIIKGVSFRDDHHLNKKKCRISPDRDGFPVADRCMSVCAFDDVCVAYESTEREGLISNCFIYYNELSENWGETQVGNFDTVIMSSKAKVYAKNKTGAHWPGGYPCNEV